MELTVEWNGMEWNENSVFLSEKSFQIDLVNYTHKGQQKGLYICF